jgi:hypothetical protein
MCWTYHTGNAQVGQQHVVTGGCHTLLPNLVTWSQIGNKAMGANSVLKSGVGTLLQKSKLYKVNTESKSLLT